MISLKKKEDCKYYTWAMYSDFAECTDQWTINLVDGNYINDMFAYLDFTDTRGN